MAFHSPYKDCSLCGGRGYYFPDSCHMDEDCKERDCYVCERRWMLEMNE